MALVKTKTATYAFIFVNNMAFAVFAMYGAYRAIFDTPSASVAFDVYVDFRTSSCQVNKTM
jgi:hypothetical protein